MRELEKGKWAECERDKKGRNGEGIGREGWREKTGGGRREEEDGGICEG